MKYLALLLAFVLLTGCGMPQNVQVQESPTSEEVRQTAQEEGPAEDVPSAEEEDASSSEEAPPAEEEIPAAEALPELPYPVYCAGDTAVTADGQILLQVTNRTLQLLLDDVTGQPRGILVTSDGQLEDLYDLSGQPVLEALNGSSWGCTADLFWYGSFSDLTLVQRSAREVLQDGLVQVVPAGDRIALQPVFWNSPCILVNSYGSQVLELDRGFRLVQVYESNEQAWLAMEARDGTQTLIDLDGNVCLPQFYTEILAVTNGCALVRQEDQFLAVDLSTEKTFFRHDQPFTLLNNTILLSNSDSAKTLTDWNGQQRFGPVLSSSYAWDADGDSQSDLVFCETLEGTDYMTTVLDPDGQVLYTIPVQLSFVTPLSATQVFYAVTTGAGFQQSGYLVDLAQQTETFLFAGSFLQVQPVETTDGLLLLCRSSDQDDRILQPDGVQILPAGTYTYAGGDLFYCILDGQEGLIAADGTWIYEKTSPQNS